MINRINNDTHYRSTKRIKLEYKSLKGNSTPTVFSPSSPLRTEEDKYIEFYDKINKENEEIEIYMKFISRRDTFKLEEFEIFFRCFS